MTLPRRAALIVAVSDRRRLGAPEQELSERFVTWAAGVARAGVDVIQIRERDLDGGPLLSLVRRILAATAATSTRVIVNERSDVALAAGAAGVHLPGSAPPAVRVRAIAPSDFLIGRSVHALDEAVEAERRGGCDYLTFGTVFPSASKPPEHRAAGVAALKQVTSAVSLPVIAIGGISVERAGEIANAGAIGIAAIGLFAHAWNPCRDEALTELVRALRQAWEIDASQAGK